MKVILLLMVLVALGALIATFITKKLWKLKNLKHFFRNTNNNHIPDGVEDIVNEVKERIDNVGEEIDDVIDAAKGKKKRGRPRKIK